MSLPSDLQARLEKEIGAPITHIQTVRGGDINEAARLETSGETFFLKWNLRAPAGMFHAEARGLELLASADAIRVPGVIAYGDVPDFLLLEWIQPERPQNKDRMAERLGEGLAAVHQLMDDSHGLDHENFIGPLPQANPREDHWPTFYAEHRIGQQQRLAAQNGILPPGRERRLNEIRARIDEWLPDAPPSLLHGDLWGGNFMSSADDTPVIYDPAVYFGHREVDLAFTELFGGFPARFYEAYQSVFPVDPGYEDRKQLYQLYPLMVHMNLFGGGYIAQVDQITEHYLTR
jgi:fructosamine-3-kinase